MIPVRSQSDVKPPLTLPSFSVRRHVLIKAYQTLYYVQPTRRVDINLPFYNTVYTAIMIPIILYSWLIIVSLFLLISCSLIVFPCKVPSWWLLHNLGVFKKGLHQSLNAWSSFSHRIHHFGDIGQTFILYTPIILIDNRTVTMVSIPRSLWSHDSYPMISHGHPLVIPRTY